MPLPPGRSQHGTQLALSYDPATGNGPFGFGWSLDLPRISRRTDRGLPRYDDTDVFTLPGADDLVPILDDNGEIVDDDTTVPGAVIRRYRPRVDGRFERIERWTVDGDDVHWRTISADNVLRRYGTTAASREFDPADPSRVSSWLVTECRDDRGNAIVYDYAAEDGVGVDVGAAHERHRGPPDDLSRTAKRYLRSVRYGNATTLLTQSGRRPRELAADEVDGTRWMFHVELDYGDADPEAPDHIGTWRVREDPFSTYRFGFEIRTYRRCSRLLVFHDFPDDPEVGSHRLVRSLELAYSTTPLASTATDPGYSFLRSVLHVSHQFVDGTWHARQLPPVELSYSEPVIDDQLRALDSQSVQNLTESAAGFRWIALDGDGLAGVLIEQNGTWFYKPNLGDIGSGPRLGDLVTVPLRPSTAVLDAGRQLVVDLEADGALDVVDLRAPLPGFSARDERAGWRPFRPFEQRPDIDWDDPTLRFVDLTGDGRADVLIAGADVLTWYPSVGAAGFGPAAVSRPLDDHAGPRLVFADNHEAVYLADMSGDGLSDLVRIRNGETCYWPNLGYGRFGLRIEMDDAPRFDSREAFDRHRLRLADVDGSGTADVIYLGGDGAQLWVNRSGNAWSEPRRLDVPVATSEVDRVQVVDLRGTGTACLVWPAAQPTADGRPLRFLDLMGGVKPHLLTGVRNNLGAVTTLAYQPSTAFATRDREAGTPWLSKLPFPVHCVARMTIEDFRRRTVFATSYTYHHGCYEGIEQASFAALVVSSRSTPNASKPSRPLTMAAPR